MRAFASRCISRRRRARGRERCCGARAACGGVSGNFARDWRLGARPWQALGRAWKAGDARGQYRAMKSGRRGMVAAAGSSETEEQLNGGGGKTAGI